MTLVESQISGPAGSGTWLVVNTRPHQEAYARENLVRQDFHVYCPMISKRIRHARRAHDAPRPLFPGYIFVEQRAQQSWRPILGTYGVKTLVTSGDRPSVLPGRFVEALKVREIGGVICKPAAALEVGQRVEVQGGPLGGLIGKIIALRDKERVLVLLNLLDQETRTHIRVDMLSPL
jgi:transcriptional antiterminator RfaH